MEIAIIADDTKKEITTHFCIAYSGILARHNICATHITGKYISEATNLEIDQLLPGDIGGVEQIASRIAYNEIDLLLFFRNTEPREMPDEIGDYILRMCDLHDVAVATNIATAEALIMAVDKGALDWREFVNPRSAYNRAHKR
ncbi:MAG: methylglyoxal synthase [Clostridia bacterium]|nr:methylglyoxal synthase [Clostridia bacterium]